MTETRTKGPAYTKLDYPMEYLKGYVEGQGLLFSVKLTPEERDHVAHCLWAIVEWYNNGHPVGDFLTAVLKNDFMTATLNADDTNRKALFIYALFTYNRLPSNYWVRAKEL